MALNAGTRLGPYEVVGAIGAGGMGEVYKATDTRLNRTVAIKILPSHAAGEEMKARFAREAQTIAGLSHPNICTLHDVGHDEGIDYLVLEYLEGQTLADRLADGAMPLAEALKIAIDIADALTKAHRQGIVHRDLKPANVMLTKSGPKLLDFGLAKWTSTEGESLAAAPTRADITGQGVMLGTLQYMAPEQIEGKDADARTDVFAFGALLYEMVTGRKAFQGKTQATLIASIMSRDPRPLSEFVSISPPALEHLVERCLQKEPDNRWQTAHSLVMQLRWIAYGGSGTAPVAVVSEDDAKRRRIGVIALGLATLCVVVFAFPAFLYFRGPEPGEPFSYRVPVRGVEPGDIAVSPDGRTLALVAEPQISSRALHVRPVGSLTTRVLAGTADAAQPFWSPDSKFIAFVTGGKLKKIDAAGGPAQFICDAPGFTGGTWSPSGTIIFGSPDGLFRVSEEGGTPEALTTVEEGESGHYWPHALPDGRHYLYLAWATEPTNRAVYAASLGETGRTKVVNAETNIAYADEGYLFFHREATLFAQPFEAGSLALTGEAVQVAGGLSFDRATGRGHFDVSQAGVLLYYEGSVAATAASRAGPTATSPLGFVDRSGALGAAAVPPPAPSYGDFDLSPDGSQIAITRPEGGTADIWIVDWKRGVTSKLTLDAGDNINPVWSNDSKRVAFTSYRNGNADVFVMNADRVGEAEALLSSPKDERVEAWSKDGRYLAYELGEGNQEDIWVLPLAKDAAAEPFAVVTGPYRKGEPQFSPDGKWLAFVSNETSQFEVYIQSFPDGLQRKMVSIGGGGQPRWSPDGRELYYRLQSQFKVVELTGTDPLAVSSPRDLFSGTYCCNLTVETRHGWSVSPDGRFLVQAPQLTAGNSAGAARGRAGAVPRAPTAVNLSAAAGGGRGRSGPIRPGLTVMLDWRAALRGKAK
jgi:Tol biopolymer transport system component